MPSCDNTDGDIMKNKRTPKFLKELQRKNQFGYLKADYPNKKEFSETLAIVMAAKPARKEQAKAVAEVLPADLKALVSIATNAWRAKTKMLDATTGEVREEMKRVDRHIEAIYRNLAEVGIVIRDHTDEVYDEGQPMKVVASKPTQGLHKKRVSETLLPSIFWNNRLIQNGEIEIATPLTPTESQ
jgi:hypothetical protein